MRLKTYTAPTIAQALDMIRRDLGDSAIIIQTQGERGGRGARVTAAVEDRTDMGPNRDRHEAPPSSVPAPSRTASAIAAIKAALDRHGVPHPLVQIIVAEASTYGEEQALLSLSAALDTVLTFQPICERTQPRPILLFGPPGCGKTLTAAKLVVRARRFGGRLPPYPPTSLAPVAWSNWHP